MTITSLCGCRSPACPPCDSQVACPFSRHTFHIGPHTFYTHTLTHVCSTHRTLVNHPTSILVRLKRRHVWGHSNPRALLLYSAPFPASVGTACLFPQVFEILLSRGYSENNFREDLKSLYSKLGLENKMMIFLFTDAHVAEEGFLELINNMLTSGTAHPLAGTSSFTSHCSLRQAWQSMLAHKPLQFSAGQLSPPLLLLWVYRLLSSSLPHRIVL